MDDSRTNEKMEPLGHGATAKSADNGPAPECNVNHAGAVPGDVSRRLFLRAGVAAAGIGIASRAVPASGAAVQKSAQSTDPTRPSTRPARLSSFFYLLRPPDAVTAFPHFERTLPIGRLALTRQGERWTAQGMAVECAQASDSLTLSLDCPSSPVSVVHVRWQMKVPPNLLLLGDAWERSYGELGWRNLVPERVMPWYFAAWDGAACHGYGVKTDAGALCFWSVDLEGVSLWFNVTNGGNGVELGNRKLTMATIVSRPGAAGEDQVDALRDLCHRMCTRKTRPSIPVYGANDWDYSYGQSSAESILRDTDFIVEVSPPAGPRPFSVIDGGWSEGAPAWPDMGKLAGEIRQRNARPGLWVRPLEAPENSAGSLLVSDKRFGERSGRAREFAYDPTVPEAREKIHAKFRQAVEWGYEMVKHDFSTYDLLGRWGFEMGPQPTSPGWSLADRSRTNAEIIADLYALVRESVGDRVLLDGCNTMGHLGQGIFDLQRIGDDTSGHQWERTRRMGVNALSFRLPQNGAFFTVDADLVGMTDAVPWELNRQWLDVLARSGTATIVSAAPSQRGPEQRAALKDAFQMAANGGAGIRPVDWMQTSTPEDWRRAVPTGAGKQTRYQWSGSDGASPFLSP